MQLNMFTPNTFSFACVRVLVEGLQLPNVKSGASYGQCPYVLPCLYRPSVSACILLISFGRDLQGQENKIMFNSHASMQPLMRGPAAVGARIRENNIP